MLLEKAFVVYFNFLGPEVLISMDMQVVRWGRSVYANIQKFIQFQLTVNVAALIINVVAAVSAGDVPLNAVQVCCPSLFMKMPINRYFTLSSLCFKCVNAPKLAHLFGYHAASLGESYHGYSWSTCPRNGATH